MYVTFGEIMLRLAPRGCLRLRQALPGELEATFGGGEANVAVSLALFGNAVRYVTALPRNPVAESLLAALRGAGVDTSRVLLRPDGRLGIYFLETGANQRGSTVTYDRAGSAIALAAPSEYDFAGALAGANWVHVTGITPALGENAFLSTLDLVRLAQQRGAKVSCDLNFRKKLWSWRTGTAARDLARECMSRILPHVDLVMANEEDAADVLGLHAAGTSVEEGRLDVAAYEAVARRIVQMFPNVSRVAITLRASVSASHNDWGGMLFDAGRDRAFLAPTDADGRYTPYEIRSIVDRVGAGDSFGAGLIHALNSKEWSEPDRAIRFAAAASCLKHSIVGDFNWATADEVAALARGDASGRVRR